MPGPPLEWCSAEASAWIFGQDFQTRNSYDHARSLVPVSHAVGIRFTGGTTLLHIMADYLRTQVRLSIAHSKKKKPPELFYIPLGDLLKKSQGSRSS